MKTKKYFIVPILALLAASCQDDLQEGGGSTQLATGEEVTFGATLGESTTTRTTYGELSDNAYPIYWESGDLVIVTSPDCASDGGNGRATYSVSVDGDKQNYASNLTKTGETGVQWGTNETGTFYSVYPASDDVEFDNNLTTVTLNMPTQQDCSAYVDEKENTVVNPDMDACFMYAKTADVASGSTVNLKYIPISTAIRFILNGPTSGEVTISRIDFIAPSGTPISGKFKVYLSNADGSTVPTMKAVSGSTSNSVSIDASYSSTGGLLNLGAGKQVEMNVFLLLEEETNVTSGWSIQIVTPGAIYTKTLELRSEDNNTLVPGKVHNLPELPALESKEWNVAKWMTNLPRNVYLSEISIPGSWNSVNSDFQTSTSIEAQYNAGARAFHIDTRWRSTSTYLPLVSTTCNANTIDGTLAVLDGGNSLSVRSADGRVMDRTAPSFESVLNTITGYVQDDEYMVVYCTFGQDSYDYQTSNGGWEYAISTVCASNTKVIDATDLDKNSVVQDVLGKVIVIVNTDETVTDLGLTNSKCLFMTDMDMTLTQSTYQTENYTETTLAYGSGGTCVDALGTHAQVTANGNSGYNTDGRGYAPSLTERQTKAGNILNWSQSTHSVDGDHDTWLYLGLGGYIADTDGDEYDRNAHSTVASSLNNWIDGKVDDMEEDGFYPVGIVLMNNVTSYSDVVENILYLNSKYIKAYDPNRSPIDGSSINGTSSTSIQSAATGYNSGMKDYNTNVISWD